MTTFLSSRLTLYGLIAFALVLSGALTLKTLEARRLESERDTLHERIYNEHTGYIVRLSTCRSNSALLEADISERNDRISELEADTQERLQRSSDALAEIRTENEALSSRLDDLLNRPLVGATTCERVAEADQRILEWLEE